MDTCRLARSIEEIRRYTNAHVELKAAHHFVYNLPLDKTHSIADLIVLGVNPGETPPHYAYPGPTEETSLFDFNECSSVAESSSKKRWHKRTKEICEQANVFLGELFFWSAKNDIETKQRFGDIWKSPHMPFCIKHLNVMFEEHQPKGIIVTSLSMEKKVQRAFDLIHIERFVGRDGKRLAELYWRGGTPWIITTHWTATRGLTTRDREDIRDFIRLKTLLRPA